MFRTMSYVPGHASSASCAPPIASSTARPGACCRGLSQLAPTDVLHPSCTHSCRRGTPAHARSSQLVRAYLQHSSQCGRARVHKAQEQHQLARYRGAEVPQKGGCKPGVRWLRYASVSRASESPQRTARTWVHVEAREQPRKASALAGKGCPYADGQDAVRVQSGRTTPRHLSQSSTVVGEQGPPRHPRPPPPAEATQAASCTV